MKLVNIELTPQNIQEQVKTALAKGRHPVIDHFVEVLSWMWEVTRVSSAFCAPCFNGTGVHGYPKEVRGCCHSCPNLGETKCMGKPIGCAMYFCGGRESSTVRTPYEWGQKWGRFDIKDISNQIRNRLTKAKIRTDTYFWNGYAEETKLVLNPEQIMALKRAERYIKHEVKKFLEAK